LNSSVVPLSASPLSVNGEGEQAARGASIPPPSPFTERGARGGEVRKIRRTPQLTEPIPTGVSSSAPRRRDADATNALRVASASRRRGVLLEHKALYPYQQGGGEVGKIEGIGGKIVLSRCTLVSCPPLPRRGRGGTRSALQARDSPLPRGGRGAGGEGEKQRAPPTKVLSRLKPRLVSACQKESYASRQLAWYDGVPAVAL